MPRAERLTQYLPGREPTNPPEFNGPLILAQAMRGLEHALTRDAQRGDKPHDDYRFRTYKRALGYNPSHHGERRKKEFRIRDKYARQALHAFRENNKPLKKNPAKIIRVGREFPRLAETFDSLLTVRDGFIIPLSQFGGRVLRGDCARDERPFSPFLSHILGRDSMFLPRLYRIFYGRDATVIRVASKNVTLRTYGENGAGAYRFHTSLTDPSETDRLLRPVDLQKPLQQFADMLWDSGAGASEIKKRSALSILLAEVGDDTGPHMQIFMQYPSDSSVFSAHDWNYAPAQTLDALHGGKLSVVFLERPQAKLPSRSMIVPFVKKLLIRDGGK